MPTLKNQLFNLCREHIDKSIADAQTTIEDARDAVRNETKSSAGDKYETGREMMQQDIELSTVRIAELQRMKAALDLIDPEQLFETVQPGSLVKTTIGNFYLSVSIGKLVVDGIVYHTLTTSAPLGIHLAGKMRGDGFVFNGKMVTIEKIE